MQETLVTHLLVCGVHDDVSTEVEATGPHRGAGLQQSKLFTCMKKEFNKSEDLSIIQET